MAGLKIDVRRNHILDILHRDGQVLVSQLSELMNATPVTIRSDLDALEKDGYLERVQGGAVQTAQSYYNLEFQQRKQHKKAIKKAIAESVAMMIQDGDTLFMNSGTTTYYVALALKRHKKLNIVTNSISIALELGETPSFRVILLGGDINAQYAFIHGADAQEQLLKYKADRAILSMDGICPDGITTYHAEEAVMDRLMIQRSKQTILVADHEKLNHDGFSYVCDLNSIDTLVTDNTISKQEISEWKKLGLNVVSR